MGWGGASKASKPTGKNKTAKNRPSERASYSLNSGSRPSEGLYSLGTRYLNTATIYQVWKVTSVLRVTLSKLHFHLSLFLGPPGFFRYRGTDQLRAASISLNPPK